MHESRRYEASRWHAPVPTLAARAGSVDCPSVGQLQIVHPSGNYNRHAPWSIPKGLVDAGESLEAAARRETWEETGLTAGELHPLGSIQYQKSRKQVHAFAGPAPEAEPRLASWEIDRAEYLPVEEARRLLHVDQVPFIDRLLAWLDESAG